MDDEQIKEAMCKNAMRVSGIRALRKMRSLVDDMEHRERKNRRWSIVLLIVALVFLIVFTSVFFDRGDRYETIDLETRTAVEN